MSVLRKLVGIIKQQRQKNYRPTEYNNSKILKGQYGHDLVKDVVSTQETALISRLGSVELGCIYQFHLKNTGLRYELSDRMRWGMSNNAGFFPTDNHSLEMFSNIYFESLNQVDLMGVWYNTGEKEVCENYCNIKKYVELKCLEPYYFDNPWSELLRHKKVLVIHPFDLSIRRQFENRAILFSDQRILPDFDLITLRSVQSRGFNQTQFDTWFDALSYMKSEIDSIDYDIAIIGAGAYGLPLGAHIKSRNKMAIHLGGATQILFGIKGKRWDERWIGENLYNDHWIRPLEMEGSQANGRTGQDYW